MCPYPYRDGEVMEQLREKERGKAMNLGKKCEHKAGKTVEGNLIRCLNPDCKKIIGYVRKP